MSSKYTILIMRDDKQVRHMRFSPFWLKFFAWFLLVVILLAAAGIWGTHFFWNKGFLLENRLTQLERQNSELNVKLERLQNMETFLGASENPILPVQDTGPAENTPAEDGQEADLDLTGLPGLVDAEGNATATGPENAIETLASPDPNASPVKLENINLRVNSPKTIRLGLDFVNVAGRQLRGHAALDLITSSGEVSAVVPTQDLDFVMARMKRGNTTFPLPEGVNMEDVEKIRITVYVGEEIVLVEEAPLHTEPQE